MMCWFKFGNGYWNFDEIIAIIIYLLAASLKSISVISGGPLSFIIVKLFCIQLHREEFIELYFRLVWITLNVEQRKNVKKELYQIVELKANKNSIHNLMRTYLRSILITFSSQK